MKRKLLAITLCLTLLMPFCLQGTVVAEDYVGTLLRDAIAADDADAAYEDFSVVTFPVTLFNYDPLTFDSSFEGTNNFKFMNYPDSAYHSMPANREPGQALQGILAAELGEDGLPDFSDALKSYGGGQVSDPDIMTALFSETAHAGKTVYSNVGFEFVYDATTGYYHYDSSANHAQYNDTTHRVELYTENLGVCDYPAGYLDGYRRGGMYVFNDISESIPSVVTTTAMTPAQWAEQIRNRQERAYASRVTGLNSNEATTDLYFAMCMEVEFYLPEGGKVNDVPLKFEFEGDDDMWVFIDGKLALDIGGGHIPVAGHIDFTTGESVVEDAVNIGFAEERNINWADIGAKTTTLDSSVTAEGMHTMKIFYMERVGGASNCHIKFNMPAIPAGSLVVSKDVEDYTDTLKDDVFTFVLTDSTGAAMANEPYLLNSLEALTTDANGQFTLKRGDMAVFSEVQVDGADTQVTVREILPEDGKYSGVKINGEADADAASSVTVTGAAQATLAFTNVRATANYTVKHYQQNASGSGYTEVTADTVTDSGFVGETVTATEKSYDGFYNIGDATVSKVITADGNTELAFYYDRSSSSYTVKYHLQNVAGTGYEHQADDDETKYGPVGETPTFDAKDYTGFTQERVEYVPDDSIEGDGTTVVNVYYTRDTYTLTWTVTKDDTGETTTVGTPTQVKYGATITAPTVTAPNGYSFGAWETYPATMPAEALTINGTLVRQYGDLKIQKSWSDNSTDKSAVFEVTDSKGNTLTVTVAAGSTSATVAHLPVGENYTVTELDWAQGYTCASSGATTVTITAGNTAVVNFTNTADTYPWLRGEGYKDNQFGAYGGGTI